MPRPAWDFSWQPPAEPPGTWDTAERLCCPDDCERCNSSELYDISAIESRPE